uniref:SAM domain-containing protein n=1 Tax=Anabas testudineus TaxID=64144 RepID=A0A7N6FFX9_ANATE
MLVLLKQQPFVTIFVFSTDRDYVARIGLGVILNLTRQQEDAQLARSVSGILEHMFKHTEETSVHLIANGALDALLFWCRSTDPTVLRHCAVALANCAMYGSHRCQRWMIEKQAAEWLFPLAFSKEDELSSCLAVTVLARLEQCRALKESSCTPVLTWLQQVGFSAYCDCFQELQVDGDLLLNITDQDLSSDLGMTAGLTRKRFLRDLRVLKTYANYSTCDPNNMADWLAEVDPRFRQYTYGLVQSGVDRNNVQQLTDQQLQHDCLIDNGVHRAKILSASRKPIRPCHTDMKDWVHKVRGFSFSACIGLYVTSSCRSSRPTAFPLFILFRASSPHPFQSLLFPAPQHPHLPPFFPCHFPHSSVPFKTLLPSFLHTLLGSPS